MIKIFWSIIETMGRIVQLSKNVINQIAAGEVIERPASVVKELVENSIDAEASKISIQISNECRNIRIADNGTGIHPDDIILAFSKHATSKIETGEDLYSIKTMGFRGEALASIASISKLTIISKTANDEFGNKLVAEAGDIIEKEEFGTQLGTTIIVENLFYNVPVRYKFLKQDATEFKYIKDWVQKEAFSNPSISFKLINDGNTVFQTSGNGKIEDIVYQIYGKELKENLLIRRKYKEEFELLRTLKQHQNKLLQNLRTMRRRIPQVYFPL